MRSFWPTHIQITERDSNSITDLYAIIALSASLAKICTDTSCLPSKIAQRKRSSGSDILAAQRSSPSLYLRAYTVVERRQTVSEAKNQGILQCPLRGSGPSLRRKGYLQVPPSTPANDKSFLLTANHSRCVFQLQYVVFCVRISSSGFVASAVLF